jgi:hypothetical protein
MTIPLYELVFDLGWRLRDIPVSLSPSILLVIQGRPSPKLHGVSQLISSFNAKQGNL